MKMLIYYELKKMFSFRKTLICTVTAAAACAAIFFGLASSNRLSENLSDIKQELSASAGKMTDERMENAAKRYEEIINDPNNYKEENGEQIFDPPAEIRAEMNSFESILHKNTINKYPERIIWNLQEEAAGSDVSAGRKILIKQNIEMVSRKGSLVYGYNLFYDYYNSFVKGYAPGLLGFFILFFTAPVFSNEYAVRMDGLILSSRHGKRGIIIAKFAAVLIGITAVFALVTGIYILTAGAVLGFSGGETSLTAMYYDVHQYIESPYNFTMSQFLLLSLGVSWAACIGFGVFIMFVSSKLRNPLAVSAAGFIVFYLPLIFCAAAAKRENLTGVINFAYGRIMQTAPLIDIFDGFVIFGKVIMVKDAALFLLASVTVLLALLTYRSFRRQQAAN